MGVLNINTPQPATKRKYLHLRSFQISFHAFMQCMRKKCIDFCNVSGIFVSQLINITDMHAEYGILDKMLA